jgi:hypothetical protein
VSRHPVLTRTLRVVRAAQLAMLVLFVAYLVSVQINAVAYLAGRHSPVIRGAVPPVGLHSAAAATADIIAGLVFEAIAALILFIVAALFRSVIQEHKIHRSRARAHSIGAVNRR